MQEDPRDTVRALAALAGVPMTAQRVAAAALTLPLVKASADALYGIDYGETEPACRFRPPEAPR